MKKVLILLALVAAASAFVVLVSGEKSADRNAEEASDDSTLDYLGV